MPLSCWLVLAFFAAPTRAPQEMPVAVPWPDESVEEIEPAVRAEPPAPKPGPAVARARLRGRVLAFGDRTPVAGARIVPADGSPPAETAEDGSFSVDLPPGDHALIVRATGFTDLPTRVRLAPAQDLEIEYRLDPVIDGARYRTVVKHEREVAVSSTTLREAEIREVAGTRGDPLRVIQSLPGTAQLAGFLPYVVVRGAAPGNTGYYLDGTRVPILFHVALGPSVIHPYFIDAVDFYPGGAPVRLGRYVSGIIEARTRPAQRDRVHGDVDVRLTDAGGLLEIPIRRSYLPDCREKKQWKCKRGPGKGALTIAGRYSYTAAILSLVQADVRIRFWDYQGRFDHALGKSADLTIFGYGSFDDIGPKAYDDPTTGERIRPDPYLRFAFHRLDTRVRQRLRRGGSAIYALVLGLDQTGLAQLATNEWRVAPRVDLRIAVNDRTTIGVGVDQEFQVFRLANPLDSLGDIGNVEDLALLFSDRFVSATGVYADVMWRKNAVEIRPGVRVDNYVQVGSSPYLPTAKGVTQAFGIDPRLILRERVHPRVWLRQSAGMYHQPPSFPIPIPGIESFGFERGLQRNIQGSFGYEAELVRKRLQLVQEAYLGYLSNLQDYELGEASEEDPVDELEDVITQVTGWAYGLETMLRLDPELRVFGWAAYTLSRSTRNFQIGGHAPSNWDQRHIFNFVLGYRISHKWNVGTRVHYHTGRPWTAPYENQSTLEALSENRNNARLPAFFQLDFRIERNWRFKNWQLDAFLDVANATYSKEIYACSPQQAADEDLPIPRGAVIGRMIEAKAANGVSACTPQGFRYVIPSVGMRGRF